MIHFQVIFAPMRTIIYCLTLTLLASPAAAQVAINPTTTTPASWERFALRVINQTDTPTVAVRLEVPAVIMVLGVEPKSGWIVDVTATQAPDSAPTVITWRGGSVKRGEYGEFPFLGRLQATARQEDIVMPVRIERANGSVVEWRRGRGESYAAPRVEVAGTTRVSSAGSMVMSGLAVGIAILALVIALAARAAKAR